MNLLLRLSICVLCNCGSHNTNPPLPTSYFQVNTAAEQLYQNVVAPSTPVRVGRGGRNGKSRGP